MNYCPNCGSKLEENIDSCLKKAQKGERGKTLCHIGVKLCTLCDLNG